MVRQPANIPMFLAIILVAFPCWVTSGEPEAYAAAGPGASPSVPTNRVVTMTSSGRFMVVGPDAASNMAISRWAEQTTGQLERFLGLKFPWRRGWVIELRVTGGKEGTRFLAGYEGEAFRRVLLMPAWPAGDLERADELLCRALTAGWLEASRKGASGDGGSALPVWLTLGMAQNVNMERRLRNRGLLSAWRLDGGLPAVSTALQWQSVPEGWPRYRAVCGMMLGWMSACGDKGSPCLRILEHLGETGGVTADWLAVNVVGVRSVSGMDEAWRTWMSRQSGLIQTFGELSSRWIAQLRSEIPLVVTAAGVEEVLSGQDAIRRRREHGVARAALEKSQRLRMLTIGKAPELTAAGEDYARFYDSLSEGAPYWVLRYQLRRAERAVDDLDTLTRRREAYLDAVEQELEGRRGRRGPGTARMPVLEKGAIERYLDEAETKFAVHPQETGGKDTP